MFKQGRPRLLPIFVDRELLTSELVTVHREAMDDYVDAIPSHILFRLSVSAYPPYRIVLVEIG